MRFTLRLFAAGQLAERLATVVLRPFMLSRDVPLVVYCFAAFFTSVRDFPDIGPRLPVTTDLASFRHEAKLILRSLVPVVRATSRAIALACL